MHGQTQQGPAPWLLKAPETIDGYHPIDTYGMIGDLHTCALVSRAGGLDWCCFPVFDSASLFAAILDTEKGGTFQVSPDGPFQSRNNYLYGTNILTTTFEAEAGSLQVLDYMPILNGDGTRDEVNTGYICRHLECNRGHEMAVRIRFDPRPNYARESARLVFAPQGAEDASLGLRLQSSHPIDWDGDSGIGIIHLSHGDSARLVLSWGRETPIQNLFSWTDRNFLFTRQYWEHWLDQCLYKGRWRRMVERSALTLKLLTFKPTGAILAAPTASLPEGIGGIRNWDYRFSWLRDSALILNALITIGFIDEAHEYLDWVADKLPGHMERVPILYPIGEEDTTPELTLDHLSGYRNSKPVRIGNAAVDQVQLDVYGEVIDAIFVHACNGGHIGEDLWEYVRDFARRITDEWYEKDEGIWEVRGEKHHFTYSKLMSWVGLDRAIRIGRAEGFEGDFDAWMGAREAVRDFIMDHCVHPEKGYLMQSPESHAADASNLLAIILQFLPIEHPVVQNTITETLDQLTRDGLVFRYLTEDGLEGEEGTFNICTFWLVEALALSGRLEEAQAMFNKMLDRSGVLGLYAEETEVGTDVALGNFPQAFSHVGLINAALTLNSGLGRILKP